MSAALPSRSRTFTAQRGLRRAVLLGLTLAAGLLARGQIIIPNISGGNVGLYTTAGATINASFITGLNNPGSFAFLSIPEPTTWAMLLTGTGLMALRAVRRRR